MLRFEYPYNDNYDLIRHYSDDGHSLIQVETGAEYGEAIDRYPSKYTYVESENLILEEEEES